MNDARSEGERLLAGIVDALPNIIVVKDADDLRLVLLNDAGQAFFGAPLDRVRGKSDSELFPADQAAVLVSQDRAALAGGVPVETPEEDVLSPVAGLRILHTTRIPIAGDQGRPRYLLRISEDITERKAAARYREDLERQLHEAQKMEAVGHLAGGVAHDFNNLLTVILGAGQALLETIGPDHTERPEVEDIVASAHRGAELTRQLLAFSRRQVLELRVLDVNAVVANVERLLRRLIGEDINLLTVPARDIGLVRADPSQLEQVIANLAVNARDAMPHGGTLTLATANVMLDEPFARAHPGAGIGPHVMLAVSDTGTGLSPEARAHLFEPFFTTKKPGKGTGLGLSTVYGIVRQSGGCIVVESPSGRGTTFRIYLPRVHDVESAPPVELTPLATLYGSETILLVEDDAAVRQLGVRVLRGYGYSMLSAPDADAAARLAAECPGPIHLLVTDVILPGRSGAALAAELTAARGELGVLYVSGYTDDAVAHHGVLAPGVALLQKPFTPVALARRVREILDRRG